MSKRSPFKILTGARQALAFARGELTEGFVVHAPEAVDVKAIRRRHGMSQAQFGAAFASKRGLLDDAGRLWQHGGAMASDVKTLDAGLAERERVLRILHEKAPQLRARGITRLSLFGSMARGEAGPESDIDLLIETESAAKVGLFDLFDLREELGQRFGRPVSFAFRSQMRPWLQEWIEQDRIEIY